MKSILVKNKGGVNETIEEAKVKIKKGGLDPYDSICHESKTKDIVDTDIPQNTKKE